MNDQKKSIKNSTSKKPVLLFDGVCNLCNGWVNFVIDHDPEARIRFTPMQSESGRLLMESAGYRRDTMDTVILIDNGDVYERSDAVFQITRYLRGSIRLIRIGKIIPRRVRDAIYDLIARRRYQWFGKREECRIPEPGVKERFIEFSDE